MQPSDLPLTRDRAQQGGLAQRPDDLALMKAHLVPLHPTSRCCIVFDTTHAFACRRSSSTRSPGSGGSHSGHHFPSKYGEVSGWPHGCVQMGI